jgi:RNA-directed DNA polymerase
MIATARGGGVEALADHRSRPDRVWNRIPDDVRGQIIDLALESAPRELAVRYRQAGLSSAWR